MAISRLFVEIGGDSSKLVKATNEALENLKKAGVEATNTGKRFISAFEDSVNPTKKLATEIDFLAKAGKSSSQIWAVYGDKLKAAADTAAKYGQSVDPIIEKQIRLSQSSDNLTRNYIELGKAAGTSKISFESLGQGILSFANNPVAAAKNGISSFLASLGPTAVALGAMGSAAIGASIGVFKIAESAADAAEQVQNLAYSTGQTVEQVQALQRLGKETGLGDLNSTIEKLNAQLGDKSGGEFTEAILRMNIAIKEGAGATYYLEEMRKKYTEIPDATKRAEQAAADLGRRLIHELGPIVLNTSQSITEALHEIEKSGATMSSAQIAKLNELDTAIDKHGRTWEWLKNQVKIWTGEATLSFMKMVEAFKQLPSDPVGWAEYNGDGDWTASVGRKDWTGSSGTFGKGVSDTSELTKRAKIIAEADALVAGTKRELIALTIKLKDLEQQYAEEKSKQKGLDFDAGKLKALANEINAVKQSIDAQKEAAEAAKRLAKEEENLNERMKRMEWSVLSARTEAAAQSYRDVAKAAADSSTELLRNAEAIDKAKKKYETLEPIPIKLDWELPGELPVTKAIKEAEAEAQKSIDTLRDDAGSIFDAMIASGKTGFTSLLDWIEGFWLTKLRTLFQNVVQYLTGGMQGGLSSIFKGVVNVSQSSATSTSSGMADYASSLGVAPQTGKTLFGLSSAAWMGIGAGFSAVAAVLPQLIKAIQGMNSYEATSKEVSRDFGGLKMSDKDVQAWMDSVGLNENEVWSKRQNMKTSPSFLLEAWEKAQSQGREQDFLRSLENVGTSWGEFDFRKAFEVGRLTDDWSALNEIWLETSKLGDAFKNMPDVLENMLIDPEDLNPYEDLVKNLNDLKKSIKETLPSTEDMYKTFLDTGVVTEELAARIKELGGSVSDFEAVSELTKVTTEWGELVQHWRDTGELLPRLITLYGQFGGSMSALNDAAQLKGLKSSLDFITSLTSQLQSQLKSPIEMLMSGIMNADVISALSGAGLDPSKFAGLTSIINAKNAFTSGNFQPFQELTPSLQKYLSEYGGSAGKTAVANYGNGFNTITQGLLDSTAAAIQEKYQNEIKSLLEYLGDSTDSTTSAIETLTASIEEQFTTVGDNIAAALNEAKEDLITAIDGIISTAVDRMIAFENDVVYDARPATNNENPNTVVGIGPDGTPITTGQMSLAEWQSIVQNMLDQNVPENLMQEWIAHNPAPSLDTGGYVEKTGMAVVHRGERYDGGQGFGTVINIQGDIYGWDDFVDKVRAAGVVLQRRAVYA